MRAIHVVAAAASLLACGGCSWWTDEEPSGCEPIVDDGELHPPQLGDRRILTAVNTGTGNFIHQWIDLRVPGRHVGLMFVRSYNAMDDLVDGDFETGRSGVLGPKWTTGVDASLRPAEADVPDVDLEFRRGDGNRVTIPADGDGGWQPPSGLQAEVEVAEVDDLGEVRKLTIDGDTVMSFDLEGRLLRTEHGTAHRVDVRRDGESTVPTTVVSEVREGASWVQEACFELLDVDADGLVDRVVSPLGVQVEYRYEDDHLVEVSRPHEGVEGMEGNAPMLEAFSYSPPALMTELRRASGERHLPAVHVSNVYDQFGRVESQVRRGTELVSFSYGPLDEATGTRSTTVRHQWPDDRGRPDHVEVFVHDEQAQLLRMEESSGAEP